MPMHLSITHFKSLRLIIVTCTLLAVSAVSWAEKKSKDNIQYEKLEVLRFDVQQGVKLPPDFVQKLTTASVAQLAKTKKFKEVIVVPDEGTQSAPVSAALRLTGTIVEFDPGSRTKRYFLAMGAGAAVVVAHVRFIDPRTGDVRFERDIFAQMTSGAFGGFVQNTAVELAREIARAAKKGL